MAFTHKGHEKVLCSCGALIRQCRCMDPAKPVREIEEGCPACKEKAVHVGEPVLAR